MTPVEELIIRMHPYAKELKDQCKNDGEFARALKVVHPERFVSLGAIILSQSPLVPEDTVLGLLVYDRKFKKFKQDFIVNIGSQNKIFILYTRHRGKYNSKKVKDINEFYSKYGKGTYYLGTHWLEYDDLPQEILPRAVWALQMAKQMDKYPSQEVPQSEIDRLDRELQELGY